VATAYIVVEPDTDGFAEKLKADLEKYDFTLKIDVDPDMDGFAEKVQAEVDALKGDDVKIPIDPDADGFREKVAAETAGEPPVEVPVTPGPFEEKLAAVIERSRVFVAASGGDVIPVSFEVNEGSFVRIAALTAALAEAQKKLGDSMGGGMSSMERAITASLQYGQALELLINREGMMADESHLAAKSFAGDWQSAVAQANADLENATSHIEASGAAINSFGEDAAGAIAPLRALADASGTDVAAAMNKTDQAAKEGANTFRLWGTGIRVGATALHAVISSMVEFAAVAIPATVAAGAWAAVWMQGAGNVYEHMMAVYTATEADNKMFGKTAGQAIGLGDALQTAQNKANPKVYQALGSAMLIVKSQAGELTKAGGQVGDVFDAFAAKLVVDFGPHGALGGDVNGLMSHMVSDLTGLGQVLGNVGHALLGFAAQMPGLAEVMLAGLAGVTHLAASLIDLAGHFKIAGASAITLLFAFHEFNTWGSVAVGALSKMGLATEELSGGFFSLERAAGILRNVFGILPAIISRVGSGIAAAGARLPVFGEGIASAGESMSAFGAEAGTAIAGLSTFETLGIAVVAAGLGFLIYKLLSARTAAQQFTASLETMVTKANDFSVLRDAGASLADLALKSAAATAVMNKFGTAAQRGTQLGTDVGHAAYYVSTAYQQATRDVATYNAAQVQQVGNIARTVQGSEQIAKVYHLTIPQAMGVAQAAGVNLTNALKTQGGAWTVAGQQVKDYMTDMAGMGTASGAVGSDMLAVAIQSGLAATKVDALNQAWDEFMQNVTGGTTGLASFEQALTNLTTGTSNVTTILGKTKSVTLSVKDFADSLKSFTGKGAQAWQNFGQVVGTTAPQVIDWMRTAGAEGAISGPKFQQGVLDMMSQLTPLASKSKVAQAELLGLAQQAGLNIKTFPQLQAAIKDSHASVDGFSKIIGDATINMANMSKIAQNLGNVMSGQVTAAISTAALSASHFYTDVNHLTQAQQTGSSAGKNAAYWAQQVAHAYDQAQSSAQKEATSVGKAGSNTATAGNQSQTATGKVHGFANSLVTAGGQAQTATGKVQAFNAALNALHSKSVTITTNFVATHGLKGVTGPSPLAPGAATGAVIPGYAPGVDDRLIAVGPGEGILVPEAVRGLGGAAFVHAANAKYGGSRVARGNKTGHYAGGGITASAHFGFPQDIFNINVSDTVDMGTASGGPGGLAGELRKGKSATWAHDDAETIIKAFADGSLKTAANIRAESAKTIAMLKEYYSGPAASKLESTISAQTAAMEKLAKVSATIAAMKQYASQVTSSLASDDALSNITGGTDPTTGATLPVTGQEIKAGLGKMLGQLHKFFEILGKLKKMKLSKALLSQVAQMDPADGIAYGEAIISGGSKLIAEINQDERYIQDDQTKIGQRAADIQYGQSINKGFLKGLEGDKAALEKAGDLIARELAKALGIPLKDIPGASGGGGHHAHHAAHHHEHQKPAPGRDHHHKAATDQHITINLNGSKGKLTHEEITGVSHEIGKMLALA